MLVAAGVIGFAYDSSFETGQGIDGDIVFGILEVNGIHNLVHIGSGLLLLLVGPERVSARIGLIDGEDVITLLPVNPADNVLHVVLAVLAVVMGLASPADDARYAGKRGGTGASA